MLPAARRFGRQAPQLLSSLSRLKGDVEQADTNAAAKTLPCYFLPACCDEAEQTPDTGMIETVGRCIVPSADPLSVSHRVRGGGGACE